IPVRERALLEGDRIEVGQSVFLFLISDEETFVPKTAIDEGLAAVPTVRLRLEDALYLEPERLLTSLPLTARIAKALDALLKLSRSIQAEYESETLQQVILQTIFELTPAERGALILLDDRTKEIESIRSYDRKMQRIDQAISMSVVELVLHDQTALLSNDISQS